MTTTTDRKFKIGDQVRTIEIHSEVPITYLGTVGLRLWLRCRGVCWWLLRSLRRWTLRVVATQSATLQQPLMRGGLLPETAMSDLAPTTRRNDLGFLRSLRRDPPVAPVSLPGTRGSHS
jgi:hypothetical protein